MEFSIQRQAGIEAELLSDQTADHWWYRGREAVLRRYFVRHSGAKGHPGSFRFLDYGAGDGRFAAWVAGEYPRAEVWAADGSPALLAAIRSGCGDAVRPLQVSGLPLPLGGRPYDVITLWDVLEHVEDDRALLCALRADLVSSGRLLLSVPAHPWLYGPHDQRVGHVRRYRMKDVRRLLRECGLEVQHASWYMTHLFPAMVGSRLLMQARPEQDRQTVGEGAGLRIPPAPINQALTKIFGAERFLAAGPGYPFGGSLLVTAVAPR